MRLLLRFPLLLALRRRSRATVLCFFVLTIVVFTLFRTDMDSSEAKLRAGQARDDHFSKYLAIVTPWGRTKPTHEVAQPAQVQLPAAIDTGVNLLPEIPPTLQTDDDELEGDEDVVPDDYSEEAHSGDLPDHDWRTDGLLAVNPDGAHPIYELVRRAALQWEKKQRRASKTLKQAVREYERRYNRLPPKGFNHWWDYVQKHNVQLPDEYDQIYKDLEPYWGVDPLELRTAQAEWEAHRDSFTLGKDSQEHVVTIVNMSMAKERETEFLKWGAKPQMDLLKDVYQFIPPFRATFSPHDNPNQFVDWAWKNAAVEAAKKGTYIKPEDLQPIERRGWSAACPPYSPLYLDPPSIGDKPTPQTSKTFIHDHRAAMDPCYHPQHILTHGTFLSFESNIVPSRFPAPQLSNCATSLHADIHATSLSQSSVFAKDDPLWEEKEDDRLLWRGTPTGMWHRKDLSWRSSQRVRLVNLTGPVAESMPSVEDEDDFSLVRYLRPGRPANKPVGEPAEEDRANLNDALMDIGFAGDVGNCEADICDVMQQELTWRPRVDTSPRGAGRYKYFIDVDGNGWSARFRQLMSRHALVFKATLFPEWWTDRVQAWVHYVPVQVDYSDLYDNLVFFGGDLSGEGAHDEMAKTIANAGRDWVSRYWREEDVTAYMFRLWLEYARVMSVDRESMTFHLPTNN